MLATLILLATNAGADTIPRCWLADQPGQDIQDGLFRVFIPTDEAMSSHNVALIMLLLSQSLASQTAAGAPSSLSYIEVDMYGETKYWQPTAAFPTLDSYKTAILNSMAPVLSLRATIQCAANHPHTHD